VSVSHPTSPRQAGRPRSDGLPVLWHLKVSNYNEKARWALDHKGVAHVRRAANPGSHSRIARELTGGSTFPVLVLDGEAIGDSTAIIAALERRKPHPPLYPSDPEARQQALELEDFFDEELGPYVRAIAVHSLLADRDVMLRTFAPDLSRARRFFARATFRRLSPRIDARFGMDDEANVQHAYQKVHAAGERFKVALGPSGYLVGDRFSVADLTLAALVAPVVAPKQYPYAQPQRGHAALVPLREALNDGGILDWTMDIYARHRGVSSEVAVPRAV
jgi:glutathione S-transferase